MVWLPDGEKIMKICLFVLTEYTNATGGRTDERHLTYAQHHMAKKYTICQSNEYLKVNK